MNQPSAKPKTISKYYCSLFGHQYQVSKKVTYHVKEYKCRHCQKELTTNGNGKLTELTPKFREINSILERIHSNRLRRSQENRLVS